MAAECKRSCSLWDTTNSVFCVPPYKGGFLIVFWKMQTVSASVLVLFKYWTFSDFLTYCQQSSGFSCSSKIGFSSLFKPRWQDTSGMRGLILDGTVFHFDPGKSVECYGQVALKGFLLAQSKHWNALVLGKEIRHICECFCFAQITTESHLKV